MRKFEKILIIDDNEEISDLLTDFLEVEGFTVYSAKNTTKADQYLANKQIDCIILDIMMPGEDGFSFCKRVRHEKNIPILFLSALEQDMDKIRGLSLGADDYIVKTASPAEVVARIKAVERRTLHIPNERQDKIAFGALVIHVGAREILINGEELSLTTIEFNILHYLVENANLVLTYEQIIERVWGSELYDFHSVRVYVAKLRKKLQPFHNVPEIETIRSVGYKLRVAN